MAPMASAITALNATAPMAEARKPRNVIATWMVARKRCGSSTRRRSACAAPALVGQLVEPRPAHGEQRDLGRGEHAADQDQDQDDEEVNPRVAGAGRAFRHPGVTSPSRRSSIGRAGTPTTVLPAARRG